MSSHPSIEVKEEDTFLTIKAHPNSSKSEIKLTDYDIDVYINESPDKGKANKAIIKLLSKVLSIPTSKIVLVKGQKSKTKILLLKNIKIEEILEGIK